MPLPALSVTAPVDPALTVNDVLARWPAMLPLLNAFGIDTCCGGSDTLPDAARRADVPLPVLLAAVEHGASGGAR
jgi:regulator of cell morphogenesis and NO signaling